ncbi:GAF domain-containing protein [Frondihabitans australicus]|uniref:GAF domain-containing protein n=1 Tax=Frondihabitans australicus TaxID=386892 RepID=A0A495IGK3_9MICO|nr:GAF domain-containing protein [Frondihabitans australicus]RKR75143.1 GAF domain-containing protein [Frondihabitans australicus]
MPSLLHHLVLPILRSKYESIGGRLGVPRPDDAPQSHAPGVDPDRILVFGNGAAVGWGVRSHDLALPGQIARRLSALTGRGVDVDAVADPLMTIRTAAAAVPTERLSDYDAIVVIVGVSDALRLTSAAAWRRGVLELLDVIDAHAHPGTEIVIVGIHRPSAISVFSVREAGVVDRHAARLDDITRMICDARKRTHFVEPPILPAESTAASAVPEAAVSASEAVARSRARKGFALWADAHALLLAPLLDQHVGRGTAARDRRHRPQSLEMRMDAIRALGLLDSPPEKRFDDITERARVLLGTAGAAFSIVDEDRLYNKSYSGVGRTEVPLRGAMCSVTIQSGRPFVVPDVWKDDRFVTHPSVRFYAGHPVESPDGVRIGALCVTDPEPRSADSVDLVLLRELALSVQRELAMGPVEPLESTDEVAA